MRVLFAEYPGNRWNLGGKERRTRDMAAALSQLGVEVDYLEPWQEEHRDFDILQVFGSEYYLHELIVRAHSLGKPVSLFSILVFQSVHQQRLAQLWNHVDSLLPVHTTHGLRKRILEMADWVMFSGEAERMTARDVFGLELAGSVVPSTFSKAFESADPAEFRKQHGEEEFVLYAGRIEPRKNVERIIRATRRAQVPLILIGQIDASNRAFEAQIRSAISQNDHVTYLGQLPPGDSLLLSAFAAARVSLLCSYHETCGMTNLEATVAGTNVVTSPIPSVREYMKDYAWYADPDDEQGIADAIRAAFDSEFDEAAREHVRMNFSVEASARKMLQAYETILRNAK